MKNNQENYSQLPTVMQSELISSEIDQISSKELMETVTVKLQTIVKNNPRYGEEDCKRVLELFSNGLDKNISTSFKEPLELVSYGNTVEEMRPLPPLPLTKKTRRTKSQSFGIKKDAVVKSSVDTVTKEIPIEERKTYIQKFPHKMYTQHGVCQLLSQLDKKNKLLQDYKTAMNSLQESFSECKRELEETKKLLYQRSKNFKQDEDEKKKE